MLRENQAMNDNNNHAEDEMLLGEWMDLDTNEDTTTRTTNNKNDKSDDAVRSRNNEESSRKVVAAATKRIAVDPPLSSASVAAAGKCLSSSFDFSLLSSSSSNNDYNNIPQQQQQQFTPTLLRYASSWDDGDIPRRQVDSCKRTRLLGGGVESSSLHTASQNPSELFFGGNACENAARSYKARQRSITDSPQAAATGSLRQQRSVKKGNNQKLTPASAKRHRASLHLRSPMRRVPPLTPRASALNNNHHHLANGLSHNVGNAATAATTTTTTATTAANFSSVKQPRRPKVSLGTTATAASTVLETTTDTLDSADTLESNTPFRFTSFPASLPRIHAAATAAEEEEEEEACPPTVCKRMTFGSTTGSSSHHHANHHHHHPSTRAYLLRTAGGGDDDTHNTSVSSLHHEDEGNYAYSDDDDVAGDNNTGPPHVLSPRTRLDFHQMQSPVAADDSASTASTIPQRQQGHHHESTADLNSSYLSSAGTEKAAPGLDHLSPRLFDEPTTTLHHNHRHLSTSNNRLLPRNNSRMDLELQLDSAQCSPIPGIPEEDVEAATPSGANGGGSRPNTSAGSASSCRPLPDLNAFDDDIDHSHQGSNSNNNSHNAADRSTDESGISSGRSHPSSPKLLCPPTPERTPAWAHQVDHHHHIHDQDSYPFFPSSLSQQQQQQHHHRRPRPPRRSNSLIATKVLATCEWTLLDGNLFEEQQQDAPARLMSFASVQSPLAPRTTTTRSKHHSHHGLFPSHRQDNDDHRAYADDETRDDKAKTATGDNSNDGNNKKHDNDEAPSISINFEPISLLGSGTFADVYKVQSKRDGKLYALKRSRKMFRGQRDRERALLEVRCMQRLQQGSSNNNNNKMTTPSDSLYLLFFFQAWQQDGHFFCLTELCCRSTCRDLIDDFRSQWDVVSASHGRPLPSIDSLPLHDSSGGGVKLLPDETVWKICHDVASGLRHIHSHGLVHNDIKSSNIFMVLDHHQFGPLCKIGDFGLTREAGIDDEEGDQKYMPSEVLDSGRKEASADIFSFGLMLYELSANLSFELPADGPRWHDLRRGGHTMDVPACRSSQLKGMIASMIQADPAKRPTASHLLNVDVIASSLHDKGFLQAYIADIEQLERLEEDRNAVSHSCADQTPRNNNNSGGVVAAAARTRSCSPSMMMMTVGNNNNLPAAPLIYSPEAALLS